MKDYSHFSDIDADKPVPPSLEQLKAQRVDLLIRIKEAQEGGEFLGLEFEPDPVAEARLKICLERLDKAIEFKVSQEGYANFYQDDS